MAQGGHYIRSALYHKNDLGMLQIAGIWGSVFENFEVQGDDHTIPC